MEAADIYLSSQYSDLTSKSELKPGLASSSHAPVKTTVRQLVALSLCLLLALAVIFVLPDLVARKNQQTASQPGTKQNLTGAGASRGSNTEKSVDQELLQARRLAQDSLARIQEKQRLLQGKNVSVWAGSAYTRALGDLQQGDFEYRQQRYPEALAAYTRSENVLSKLEMQIQPRLKQALDEGLTALEQGEAERATTLFQLALALEPGHTESNNKKTGNKVINPSLAQQGLARVRALPEVMKHVAEGERLLLENSPEAALQAFNGAAALDKLHPLPRSGIERAQKYIADAHYQQAMSKGLNKLNVGDHAGAISAFQQALRIAPNSAGARSGLNEAQSQLSLSKIDHWLSRGQASETDENWQDAVDSYQKALKRDSSVTAARAGEIRASTRAELDRGLENLLADPLGLASDSVYRHGEKLLADARGISHPGPRLKQQIENLQQALSVARIPIPLILQSDNATRVSLQKVGDLGNFARREVNLTPGRYVAKGYRPGYRDVRIEFVVSATPSANPQVVRVQCIETI